MRYDYRKVIPTEAPPEPGVATTQVEPDDAARYTAGSSLRSLPAETLDLLPPAQNIINTTPTAPVAEAEKATPEQPMPEPVYEPDLIVTITRETDREQDA